MPNPSPADSLNDGGGEGRGLNSMFRVLLVCLDPMLNQGVQQSVVYPGVTTTIYKGLYR
jgi:hypothetical protein